MWHSNGTGTIFSTDAQPSNLSRVNFKFACLARSVFRRADLRFSDLQGTCLVDADLTGAVTNTSTNFWNAIFCRTKMPDGSINNSGCGNGTACCPTCDERTACPPGQKCCNGKCATCPTATDCADAVCDGGKCVLVNKPNGATCPGGICCGGTCNVGKQCCSNAQCNGQVCCDGICCTGGAQCVGGTCQTCTAVTCPKGCCNVKGECVSPPTNQACGIGGAACRTCPDGQTCDAATGQCLCKPDCADKVCGPDGCGGNCGPCPAGTECNQNGTACICTAQSCPPNPQLVCKERTCVGAECKTINTTNGQPGPNCRGPQEVCQNGECVCKPDCDGKVCGPDGCGNTCGPCPENSTCNGGGTACVCDDGFKPCGSICIADNRCCFSNTPDTCGDNRKCCGGECVANDVCCVSNAPVTCSVEQCKVCDPAGTACVTKCTDPTTPDCDGKGNCICNATSCGPNKKCCDGICVPATDCCPSCKSDETCCRGNCLKTCVPAPANPPTNPKEEPFPGGDPPPGCFKIDSNELPVGGCVIREGDCGCEIEVCTESIDNEPKNLSFRPVAGKKACTIMEVDVKGGTTQNAYTFDPGALCSSGLNAPDNKGISNVVICNATCCS
jgi:hypothetical protein